MARADKFIAHPKNNEKQRWSWWPPDAGKFQAADVFRVQV